MKTTVEIPDDLLERAKSAAAREGSTVRALIEEGLRKVLLERETSAGQFKLQHVCVDGDGIDPAYEHSWEAVRDAIYLGYGA